MHIATARRIADLLLDHAKQQNQLLLDLGADNADLDAAKTIIGKVMGAIYLDALAPIFREHPSLKPDGLDLRV